MFDEPNSSLTPINFVALRCQCHQWNGSGPLQKLHRLPSTAALCTEEPFADVFMGWHKDGIAVQIDVDKPFEQCFYPAMDRGDAVELFFDTRDLKNAGFNTRFCHHFYFLPEAINGKVAGEITRFRTEDAHPLCDSAELKVTTHLKRSAYSLNIFLPAHCLVGYDPEQFDRLGFTYRIHRVGGDPQHFSVSTTEYAIDQQPSLWSSILLT